MKDDTMKGIKKTENTFSRQFHRKFKTTPKNNGNQEIAKKGLANKMCFTV